MQFLIPLDANDLKFENVIYFTVIYLPGAEENYKVVMLMKYYLWDLVQT
jgi:hypothetical protein